MGQVIEIIVPMLFSFWMVVIYAIFSVLMIFILICIGKKGGPVFRFKAPNPPEVPPVPDLSDLWQQKRN